MDISSIMNALIRQRHGCYANIQMDVFVIVNVATMQLRRCYADIPTDVSITMNAPTTQLGTSCSFDSPGLARDEPTPGEYSQGDSTP